MPRPISILALTKSTGGTAFYNRTVLRGLDSLDGGGRFESHTLCLSEQADTYAEALRADSLSAEPFPMSRYSVDPGGDLRAWRRAVALVRERGVDVIFCHGSKAGFVGRAAGATTRVPAVYRRVSMPFQRRVEGSKAPFYRALELMGRTFGGHVVTLTEDARQVTLRAGLARKDRISVIRTGIDLDRFRPRGRRDAIVASVFGLDPARPVVGWIGRLEPQKAPLDYAAALGRLAQQHPQAQFVMAGEGRQEAELGARLAELGLAGRVCRLPWQSDPSQIYEGFDILAMSSLWEGLPLTLLEAMASGAVPVATTVDGCGEVIVDGVSGRLVPPSDPAAMAAALDDLLSRPDLHAMRAAARARIETAFAQERMIADWAALLERLSDRRPADPPAAHPLRLGYVIDSLVTGGAERLVVSFAEAVAARPDIALTVFALRDGDTPFRRELEALGTPLVTLPGRSLVDPGRFARLVGALRRHRIEVVHAHLTTSTILGAAAARILRLPFAASVHNVRSSTRRVRMARQRLLNAALRASGTTRIAVGRKVAEAAAAAVGKPFLVIPNAVPPSAIWEDGDRNAVRGELGLAPDDIALLAVGGIIAQKGYVDLVDAFARIAGSRPRAKLLIAGSASWPELRESLNRQVAAAGLGARVCFLGLREDVARLLHAADLFVSASHWEGAPVSLLEAMANGLAPLVTDVGDNAYTLQGTGAPLVPPHDPAALAGAMDALVADDDRRRWIAAGAKRRVQEKYGTDLWVDRLQALYREMLDRGPAAGVAGTTGAAEAAAREGEAP